MCNEFLKTVDNVMWLAIPHVSAAETCVRSIEHNNQLFNKKHKAGIKGKRYMFKKPINSRNEKNALFM